MSGAVAVVHDYFTQRGGAERVAERMAALFPDALLFTSGTTRAALPASLADRDLRRSPVQPLLAAGVPLKALAPLLPLAMRRLPLDQAGAGVVLSSSSAFAHHVRVPPGGVQVCYCHTPARFLWQRGEYFRGKALQGRVLGPALDLLRRADTAAARRVDVYVANSAFTAERIQQFYGREARVVYPPIETRAFQPTTDRSGRFLVVARLLAHKRLDIAIAAANEIEAGLDVIGEGPALGRLRRLAGPTVRFHGRVDDETVRAALARCVALVVPGIEDFGMTTAEAQAAGRPPIAFASGGALEIVRDGVTGFLVPDQTPEAFTVAMRRALEQPLDAGDLVASAGRFDAALFDTAIREIVADAAGAARTGHPAASATAAAA